MSDPAGLQARAAEAGKKATVKTAMADFDRFIRLEMDQYEWDTRPLWRRVVDSIMRKERPS